VVAVHSKKHYGEQAGKDKIPRYCSKECQAQHWKAGGHRDACPGRKKG